MITLQQQYKMQKSTYKVWAWLCVFILFNQNLIPVQTHTAVKQNDAGQYIVICTIEGAKQVKLDSLSIPGLSDLTDEEKPVVSVAVKFSTLLAESILLLPEIPLSKVLLSIESKNELFPKAIQLAENYWFSIRAPPIA